MPIRDRRRFPPPGRLLRSGDIELHLHEQGSGEPVVVLEAGIAGSSNGWALVQPEIARFTKVCSYDRAGLGWSARHRSERTLQQMTAELAALLKASQLPPPYLLVGHSFGGLLVRAFAARYPALTGGLVLLDPVSLHTWGACSKEARRRLAIGASLSRRGAVLARFGVVRAALALLMSGRKGISKRVGRTAAGRGAAVLERLVGEVQKLPQELWPVLRAHWSDPKSFLGMAAYLESLPECAAEGLQLRVPPEIPLLIVSAGNATPEERAERDGLVGQRPWRRHDVLPDTGHWLQLERPTHVVQTVLKATQLMKQGHRHS